MDVSRGAKIALAAATLLAASGCSDAHDDGASPRLAPAIKCEGGNACQGLSECATADGKSSCTGENACKGTGYVFTQTAAQCEALQLRNKP